MSFKHILCAFLFINIFLFAKAQNTDFENIKDEKYHNPKKATIYSAVLPGLGQAYNKKYWKIPIIYGAMGTLTYMAVENNKKYKIYREAYQFRTDDKTETVDDFVGLYNDENLKILREAYRRDFEFMCVLTIVSYLVNIIDASVDAHLFEFDVSDDLSLRFEPFAENLYIAKNNIAGFKLSLKFQ